uniref:Uncharacterized protein n=1 Tax=Anguilla anguilla TaxID=7936 RepID=A0A0E9XZR8_ANGAN
MHREELEESYSKRIPHTHTHTNTHIRTIHAHTYNTHTHTHTHSEPPQSSFRKIIILAFS